MKKLSDVISDRRKHYGKKKKRKVKKRAKRNTKSK